MTLQYWRLRWKMEKTYSLRGLSKLKCCIGRNVHLKKIRGGGWYSVSHPQYGIENEIVSHPFPSVSYLLILMGIITTYNITSTRCIDTNSDDSPRWIETLHHIYQMCPSCKHYLSGFLWHSCYLYCVSIETHSVTSQKYNAAIYQCNCIARDFLEPLHWYRWA